MSFIEAKTTADFLDWKNEAKRLISIGAEPAKVWWKSEEDATFDLFSASLPSQAPTRPISFQVPAEFIERAPYVHAFRADDTSALLYRVLFRILNGERNLLKISIDPDVQEFESRYRLVKRDIHKMHAFVRFKEVDDRFIAWHRPDHRVMRLTAQFFVDRFNGMNWSILTEDECAHWDQKTLTFSEGVPRSAAPSFDAGEELWLTYYRSTFNPARIKLNAMTKEMPVRHWKTMPETAEIQNLLRTAPERLQAFYREQNPTAEKWIPKDAHTLSLLNQALPQCQACGICERATQPVMGVGPLNAEIALIGEQPGEEEDLAGLPFIGPAGKLLDQALGQLNLFREDLYVTNAVKGFKWESRERKARLHRSANPTEISACNPWLKRELEIVKPKKIVCLGRSAAQALLGKSVLMRDVRGQFFKTQFSDQTLVVPHPSSILRIQDPGLQTQEFHRFVEELRGIISG